MDENYEIDGDASGCYGDIHEAFLAIKELQMSIFYSNEGKLYVSRCMKGFIKSGAP
jgi:hypothetical protein